MAERPLSLMIARIEFRPDQILVQYHDDSRLGDVNPQANPHRVDYYIVGHPANSGKKAQSVLMPNLSDSLARQARRFASHYAPVRKEPANQQEADRAQASYMRGVEFAEKLRDELIQAMKKPERITEFAMHHTHEVEVTYRNEEGATQTATAFVRVRYGRDGQPVYSLGEVTIKIDKMRITFDQDEVRQEVGPRVLSEYPSLLKDFTRLRNEAQKSRRPRPAESAAPGKGRSKAPRHRR